MSFAFDNSYARLPDRFYRRQQPQRMPAPRLVLFNESLAGELGFDPASLTPDEIAALLCGTILPEGAEPLAMVYAGHQFGQWVPRLGDGRALLLGEAVSTAGRSYDIHLKGSGRTPFSRGGDGRAALGPVLREYIVSEAMARLGIPTTRALAAIATGDTVMREVPLPGAVLARVASSHLRVGTFQYFAAIGDQDGLRQLADHAIARLHPGAAEAENPYRALLDAVVAAQARLVADWMGIGFIHGVMNTDNTSIAGETLDYGPCAFMDAFDPGAVFSSIDSFGRYAYGNQPSIVYWNLARLAQALMSLLAPDTEAAQREAQAAIDRFPDLYEAAWLAVMRRKLGLLTAQDDDRALIRDLLTLMREAAADYTLTFRGLADALFTGDGGRGGIFSTPAFAPWLARWRSRTDSDWREPAALQRHLESVNPLFIPRNHLVEEAIAAAYAGDDAPARMLHNVLAEPFIDRPQDARYAEPPRPEQVVQQTFCGT
ncbi:YdiU family protein [Pseudochelatococcus lubricantis]|uniref:protein adenylyltransferase SelO n=1 Tax=Pseudochelatococcus lubricantis TaxID=1538102 RepID=UPI0035EFACD4